MKHTATPWNTKEKMIYSETGNGETIAFVNSESNAEFIVQACNAHDELIEACKGIEMLYAEWSKVALPDAVNSSEFKMIQDIMKKADIAIRKAEGK